MIHLFLPSIFLLFCLCHPVQSSSINLAEDWKFSPDPKAVGESKGWQSRNWPDAGWATLQAGRPWEEQGFPDLDGIAWYRKIVEVPKDWGGHPVWLVLGGVNDEYVLYCNGKRINSYGRNPDNSVANNLTIAELSESLRFGELNLLALEVHDWGEKGGLWKLHCQLVNDPKELPKVLEVSTYLSYTDRSLTVEIDPTILGNDRTERTIEFQVESSPKGSFSQTRITTLIPSAKVLDVVFDLPPSMDPITYRVKAAFADSQGKKGNIPPVTTEVKWEGQPGWPGEFSGLKVRNNFVTELAALTVPEGKEFIFQFSNPRDGWVFLSLSGDLTPGANVSFLGESRTPRKEPSTCALEIMGLQKKGKLSVRITSGAGATLSVRTVPELAYTYYPCSPHIKEHGPLDWAFLERYVLPHINTIVTYSGASEEELTGWHREGRQWLVNTSLPGLTGPPPKAEEVYRAWRNAPGLLDQRIGGLIVDEFTGASAEHYMAWNKALLLFAIDLGNSYNKVFYAFCGDLYKQKDEGATAFCRNLARHGYRFVDEKYLRERPTEKEATEDLLWQLQISMRGWKEAYPGIESQLIYCLGDLTAPPESLNVDPSVDLKVYMDMQFHLLANDPTFWNLFGVMEYTSSYADEEIIRWAHRLFRHYCIEGSTERLTTDPYKLTHVKNPDFEEGLEGWQVEAAEKESVGAGAMEGLSWLEGRYPRVVQGDRYLRMTRNAKGPNRVSQTLVDLEPGRLYSLKLFSAAIQELDKPQRLSASIDLKGAERLDPWSFQSVFASCYSHTVGPYDASHPAYMNYHRVVFRPKEAIVELVLSDWTSPTEAGGPIGQELAFNFVEVQPFLEP
jgi:hypothetical protein